MPLGWEMSASTNQSELEDGGGGHVWGVRPSRETKRWWGGAGGGRVEVVVGVQVWWVAVEEGRSRDLAKKRREGAAVSLSTWNRGL